MFSADAQLAYLRWLAQEDKAKQQWIRTLRDYLDGAHPTYLTDRQKEFLGLDAKDDKHLFSHNLCRLVVDSVVERLSVTGFSLADENEAALAEKAALWWEYNRMDSEEDNLYEFVCVDGEGFVIVSWDNEKQMPHWVINRAYDGTQGVKIHYDSDTGEPIFASKRWQSVESNGNNVRTRTRLTLYFPDRVEKYVSDVGEAGWTPITDAEDEPWPIPWVDDSGQPLGIAVIPFLNPGGSEIADLIPIQDMLNKSDIDLIAAADSSGFRILWASGLPAQIDPSTGQERKLSLSPAKVLRMSDPQAKVGAIDPPDLSRMIAVSKYWIESAAGVTRTPQYLFQTQGADQPSGESLKMQEVGLLAKIDRKQNRFGNAWENVVYLSARLWNFYRPSEPIEVVRIQTEWKSTQVRNERELMEAAQLKLAIGIPEEQVWQELGYDQQQIERFKEMKSSQQETLGSALLRQFERGA